MNFLPSEGTSMPLTELLRASIGSIPLISYTLGSLRGSSLIHMSASTVGRAMFWRLTPVEDQRPVDAPWYITFPCKRVPPPTLVRILWYFLGAVFANDMRSRIASWVPCVSSLSSILDNVPLVISSMIWPRSTIQSRNCFWLFAFDSPVIFVSRSLMLMKAFS